MENILSVRLDADEFEKIIRAGKKIGLKPTPFVRMCALERADKILVAEESLQSKLKKALFEETKKK